MRSVLDVSDLTHERRNRDTYLFDLIKEAGLDVNHSADWNNISILFEGFRDVDIAVEM